VVAWSRYQGCRFIADVALRSFVRALIPDT